MKQTDPPPAANAGSTTPHTHTHTPIHTHTMRGCGLRAALRTRTRTRTRTHTLTHGGKQTRSPVHDSGCGYPDARGGSLSLPFPPPSFTVLPPTPIFHWYGLAGVFVNPRLAPPPLSRSPPC